MSNHIFDFSDNDLPAFSAAVLLSHLRSLETQSTVAMNCPTGKLLSSPLNSGILSESLAPSMFVKILKEVLRNTRMNFV